MLKEKLNKIPVGVKSAFVYTLSSVFSRGLAVITVPIFTRLMTTAEIGVVNLYNSWVAILGIFVNLSLTSGGYSAALQEYKEKRNEYQSSVLTLTTIMAIVLLGVYAVAPSFWNGITGLPTSVMLLMLVGFLFTPAQEFWLLRQRYEYKYKLAGALTIGTSVVASAVAIFAVKELSTMNSSYVAEGRLFASHIITTLVAAAIWVFLMFRGKTFIHISYWKYSLKLSIPLIGYALALQVLSVSDRLMISSMVGKSAVGIYGTLYTVSSLSLMVWTAINSSFIPYLFQNIHKKEQQIKPISTSLMGAYALIAILLTFFAPEIVRILATKQYYEAIYIMPPIAAGVFLTSVSNMYSNVLVYYKRTKYIMMAAIVAAISNVVLNWIFIEQFGYMAAAYTTLVSYVIMSVLLAYYAIKVHKELSEGLESVYNDKLILFIAVGTMAIVLSGLIWYQNTYIRYALIVVSAILAGIIGLKILKKLKKKN